MAQCDNTLLRIEGNGPLVFKGSVSDTDQIYAARLLLSSKTGAAFLLKPTSLVDAQTNRFILAGKIELPATIRIEKGNSAEVIVSVPRPPAPGRYKGELHLRQEGDTCQWTIPLLVDFHGASEGFDIPQDDEQLTIQTCPVSWFARLLPSRIQQQGLSFRVENKSLYPAQIERIAISLKGVSSQRVLSEADFEPSNIGQELAPSEMRTLQLSLKKGIDLPPDEYKGQLQLYLKAQPEPLKATVSIFRRSSVGWALFLILLGIFVGRMLKDLDKASAQMALIDQLFRGRRKITTLADATAKWHLEDECEALEAEINTAAGEEAQKAVAQKLATLENKIAQIRQLDQIRERLSSAGNTVPPPIVAQMDRLRDAILRDDEAAITAAEAALNQLLAEKPASRGSRGLESTLEQAEMPENFTVKKKVVAVLPKAKTFWKLAEKHFSKVLALISGIRVTARLRYALFRPLAALLALAFFTLFGFQEIYVNGSGNFGAEGAYDYLKLFFWGTISDVASRSLVGNSGLQKFMGKTEPDPKPEPEG